jgi:hypothetical protein
MTEMKQGQHRFLRRGSKSEHKGGFVENVKPTRPDHQHRGPKSNVGERHLGSHDRPKRPAKSFDALFMNALQ